jgi:uncharacterized protein YciI
MLFVVHAIDKTDILPTRAKFYRAHRVHLDEAQKHDVDVVTAGTLVADDGETPSRLDPRHRRQGPRHGRRLHAQRSISCEPRLGDGANPWIQQEARHADRQQADEVEALMGHDDEVAKTIGSAGAAA